MLSAYGALAVSPRKRRLMGVALFISALVLLAADCMAQEPFPADSRVLSQHRMTGQPTNWLAVDFLTDSDPLEEAQRCVRSRPREDAVSCFAFADREAYAASSPIRAGDYAAGPCWEATWSRNGIGRENGRRRNFVSSGCPDSRERAQQQRATPQARAAPSPESAEGDFPVEIRVQHRLEPPRLFIVGTTNLPDGTVLSTMVSGDGYTGQSKTSVRDGTFQAGPFTQSGRQLPAGRYELSVTVPFFNVQPASVRRVLGQRLERMTGPDTEWMQSRSLGKVANVKARVRLP